MQIATIGLDIAKNVFQVHGIDAAEKVVVRKQLRRTPARLSEPLGAGARPVHPILRHRRPINARFVPTDIRGSDASSRHTKAKTPARPRRGLVRTYTAQALWGTGGLESARHRLTLSWIAFGICYQIAHSKSAVEKWDNSTRWQDQTAQNGRHRTSAEVARPRRFPPNCGFILNHRQYLGVYAQGPQ